MKKRIVFFLIVVCASSVSGQNIQKKLAGKNSPELLIGKFRDNWFISAGGGVNLFIGSNGQQDIREQLSPALDISAGKWMSPYLGFRLQYNGLSMNTLSDETNWFITDKNKGIYENRFNYNALHYDMLVNLSSAIGGYNPNRIYELIPFIGMGFAHSSNGSRRVTEFLAVAGLINKFRVSNSFDINCELRGAVIHKRISGEMYGGGKNFPLTATIGITYHFGGENARKFRVSQ